MRLLRRIFFILLAFGIIAAISARNRERRAVDRITEQRSSPVEGITPSRDIPNSTGTPVQTPDVLPPIPSKSSCGNGICEDTESTATCKADCCNTIYKTSEATCLKKGWEKLIVDVDGLPRRVLWKAPADAWQNGAIVALHGGSGMAANFCGDTALNNPMGEFSELALKNGFAVFAPDSAYNTATDIQGVPVGKRWDGIAREGSNADIVFLKELITKTIPGLRPEGSGAPVFMTGISNGGFMTILASTHLDNVVTAFAPVSAGDPYGTYVDTDRYAGIIERACAPGAFVDSGTHKSTSDSDACAAVSYTNEKEWVSTNPKQKPSFRQFHNRGDGGVDISCMVKAGAQLRAHEYPDLSPFLLDGNKNILNHLWKREYNQPIINFFIDRAEISG